MVILVISVLMIIPGFLVNLLNLTRQLLPIIKREISGFTMSFISAVVDSVLRALIVILEIFVL